MIDFSNVKNIIIPEGEVFTIDCCGEILWQKQTKKYKTELAYLESTGTQWIDIGKTINTATDTVELVFQNTDSSLYKWFFGEHDNAARFGMGSGDGSNKRNVAYGNATYKVNDKQQYGSKHTFIANENGVYLDGTKIAKFASFASTSTLYLFNLNLSGGNYMCGAKVWSYKHTRNGVLICDFIPVLDLDDRPCMYDKVTGELFYNKGTGVFKYEELPRLPLEYREVAYIESTGTQWIDTGIRLTSNYSVEIDYQLTKVPQSRTGIFGNLVPPVNTRYGSIISPSNGNLEHGYGLNNVYWQQGTPDTDRHRLKQEKNKVYVDGTLAYTFAEVTFTIDKSAPLGSFDYTNYKPANARYFGSKWWDNNTLVRDFVPCYRKSDNKPGMYDLATGAFFTNQGTGEFLYE